MVVVVKIGVDGVDGVDDILLPTGHLMRVG
jgi:hypothetical protein